MKRVESTRAPVCHPSDFEVALGSFITPGVFPQQTQGSRIRANMPQPLHNCLQTNMHWGTGCEYVQSWIKNTSEHPKKENSIRMVFQIFFGWHHLMVIRNPCSVSVLPLTLLWLVLLLTHPEKSPGVHQQFRSQKTEVMR